MLILSEIDHFLLTQHYNAFPIALHGRVEPLKNALDLRNLMRPFTSLWDQQKSRDEAKTGDVKYCTSFSMAVFASFLIFCWS